MARLIVAPQAQPTSTTFWITYLIREAGDPVACRYGDRRVGWASPTNALNNPANRGGYPPPYLIIVLCAVDRRELSHAPERFKRISSATPRIPSATGRVSIRP